MQRAALSRGTVKLLAQRASSLASTISRQLSHCNGVTLWFITQKITKYIFVHKCSKLVKLVAIPQLGISEPLLKLLRISLLLNASQVSFHVFHAWPMCCVVAQCMSVLENCLRQWRFHLQVQKLCCREIFRGVGPIKVQISH